MTSEKLMEHVFFIFVTAMTAILFVLVIAG
jgi:hypothetical protein